MDGVNAVSIETLPFEALEPLSLNMVRLSLLARRIRMFSRSVMLKPPP